MKLVNIKNNNTIELQFIKGVGPKRAEALANEGIKTPLDLIKYFPRAYVERNSMSNIASLYYIFQRNDFFSKEVNSNEIPLKSEYIIAAQIINTKELSFHSNKKAYILTISDESKRIAKIIFWNYAQYYAKTFKKNDYIILSGQPELSNDGIIEFNHPELEKFNPDEEEIYLSGKILPIYKITQGMKSSHWTMKLLRSTILYILDKEIDNISETLNNHIIQSYNFLSIKDTIRNLHFPESSENIEKAKYRMKFEEIFYYEILLAIRKNGLKQSEKGLIINPKSHSARSLYNNLPFVLTHDQKKVIREISADMNSGKPMNRLLQGDVGSGKTIVALLSMLTAIDNGYQTALLVPTEILAEQHFYSISNYLKNFDIRIVQLLGGQKKKLRRNILEQISSGYANIIIGTHALFQSDIEYNNLGLIVIDEQHRFGVAQRAELKILAQKSNLCGISPHVLVMSATPIPRTLSLTVYGDLDVSVIKELPKNRKPIITRIVFDSQYNEIYDFIRKKIKRGEQVYIVYPLVEKSEKLELKAATEHYETLKNEVFPDLKLGLLHGQMFWYEKEETMKAFLNKEFDILVATTVIEVGIDIPNATIMLIENSERFGLSQLHQLRGRVGRSNLQSFCLLATSEKFKFAIKQKNYDETSRKSTIIRLKTMEETIDGFKIAEVDMQLRGPGDVMGTRQSGLPAFQFLDLISDYDIITNARLTAFNIIEKDPHLRNIENSIIKNEFINKYQNHKNYFDIA